MISETSPPKDLFVVVMSLQAENAALRRQLYERPEPTADPLRQLVQKWRNRAVEMRDETRSEMTVNLYNRLLALAGVSDDHANELEAALAGVASPGSAPAPQDAEWKQHEPPDRQGCVCTCCDHSEGSDCACDCHRNGACAAPQDAVPRRWRCPDCGFANQWEAIECRKCGVISPPDRERWEFKPFVRNDRERLPSAPQEAETIQQLQQKLADYESRSPDGDGPAPKKSRAEAWRNDAVHVDVPSRSGRRLASSIEAGSTPADSHSHQQIAEQAQTITRLQAEKEEANQRAEKFKRDALYHADCRPNRRQAEAIQADAKEVNDRMADVIRENRELTADLTARTAQLQQLKRSIENLLKVVAVYGYTGGSAQRALDALAVASSPSQEAT